MSAMAELDATIRGTSTVREYAAEWISRTRKAITANEPVTITLGFADADRLATILCRIESGLNFETYDDDEEAEKDRQAVTRIFGVVCAATDAAAVAR